MEVSFPPRTGSKSSLNYRENFRREASDRKKIILHLILSYLRENNLQYVAEVLQSEAQIGLQYQVCENIDLDIVLQEYQSYYYTKFQRQPILLRKVDQMIVPPRKDKKFKEKKEASLSLSKKDTSPPLPKKDAFEFEVVNLPVTKDSNFVNVETKPLIRDFDHYSTEWKELGEQIIKQIVPNNLGISFQDCVGLNSTIETLKEAIMYPTIYPELFEKVHPWKGILLYGPPGTGKTLLAKALACESSSIFINVTSSTIISKWRGESEKMLKVLFDVAKFYSPSIIFIDEIDALASNNQDSNHEASRRFKSELLIQIDGIIKTEEVFVLATTNSPWTMDAALLRRFEKRILVPLPDKNARSNILNYYFKQHNHHFKNEHLDDVINMTENFSGSDLKLLCTEVEMMRIREEIRKIKSEKTPKRVMGLRKIKIEDLIVSLEKIKPCIRSEDYKKYVEWSLKYGIS